jgi:DNA polymerase elongation subunit (family B)
MARNADAESGSEADAFEDGDPAETEWPDAPGAPPLLYSGGAGPLRGLPTRADLVRLGGSAASDKLEAQLSVGGPVPFLPVSVAERAERSGGVQTYCLHLFGILATGAKAHVVLGGVEVSFDVRVPDGAEPAQFEHELRHFLSGSDRALRGGDLSPLEVRRHKKFPLMGYRAEPATYLRLVYAHTASRRDAVAAARAHGYETAEDDTGPYYPKASRQTGLPLAAWAVLKNYQWRRGGAHPLGEAPPRWGEPRSPRCEHVLRLGQSDYAPWVDPAAPPEARKQQADSLRKYPQLLRDRTLVLAWDIETHTSRAEQDLPLAERPEDTVFMIGLSLHWKDDAQPLHQVCLVQGAPAEPDPRWTTVQCSDETALLEAFAALLGQFAPDLVVGFNDGQYDWPFVLEKARRAGLLGRFVDEATALPGWKPTSEADAAQYNLAETKIKLGADGYRWPVTYLRVPGWVAVDVRVMFMQIFPMAEPGGQGGSLNYFLAACRLPPKADMPHSRLWRIFEKKDAAGMRRGAHYCVNDAQRCQALLVKKNVVAERRELASLAFVTLSDAVYQAISHKVQNLVGAYAAREGLVGGQIPSRVEDSRKYPGAWVFPPQKGMIPDPGAPGVADLERVRALCLAWGAPARLLPPEAARLLHRCLAPPVPAGGDAPPNPEWPGYQPGRPVTGLDFSSLYPSIIMAYNFSPETYVATEKEAAELERDGGRLHAVQFTMVGDHEATRGWFLRAPPPYPEKARAAGEALRRRAGPGGAAWFEEKLLAFLGGGARKKATGLYPQILEELYCQRASLKVSLGAHEKAREAMDLAEARRASGERWTHADELEASPPPLLAAALEGLVGAPDAEARYAAFYAENAFLAQGLDSKQKALKVFMNSFYGGAGCRSSPAYLLPLAGGVTETGRYNIHLAADFVRAQGFRLLYGDSVTGDTALVVRQAGRVATARIDELAPPEAWGPMGGKPGKEEAPAPEGLEVWQDGGFTPLRRLIRHACEKPLWRVLTHTGLVDCTEDHSLLRPDGSEAPPAEVSPGQELLHADDAGLLAELEAAETPGADYAEAWAMGLFAADGSCGRYDCPSGVKYSWAINNADRSALETAAGGLSFRTKILETMRSSGVYKLVPVGGLKAPTLRYRALFYNGAREKRVPPEILGAPLPVVLAFWEGFYAGDGSRAGRQRQTQTVVSQKGKEMATGLWLLGRRLGMSVSVNARPDKPEVFNLTFRDSKSKARKEEKAVKKIGLRPAAAAASPHVYDLETESHHFHVGPGNLVVHNTDSLYVAPPAAAFLRADEAYARAVLDREAYWGAMVRTAMEEMGALRRGVNAHIAADNGTERLRMAYEEVLFPTVFAGKKKYYGVAHVTQPNFRPKELMVKGLAVVQRGVSPLARVVATRIMERSMALDNAQGLLDIVHGALGGALASGEWEFKDFVMSACWKPAKQNVAVVRFVRRMEDRVAREKVANLDRLARGEEARPLVCWVPPPGERFPYVLRPPVDTHSLEGKKLEVRKGDLMEHAELAKAEGIRPDIAEYLSSYVVGICARFVNFLFEDRAVQSGASPHDAKTFDEKCQTLAVAHLKRHLKSLQGGGNELALGKQYRAAYSGACGSCARAPLPAAAAKVLRGRDFARAGEAAWKTFIPGHQDPGGVVAELADREWRSLGEELGNPHSPEHRRQQERLRAWAAALGVGPRGDDLRPGGADRPPRIFTAYAAYAAGGRGRRPPTIHERVQSAMERREGDLRARLAALTGGLAPIALRYETGFTNLVHDWRKKVAAQAAGEPEFDFGLSPKEAADLAAYWGAWQALRAAHLARADRAAFVRHLGALKARRQGGVLAPPPAEIAQAIASGAQRLSPLGYAVQGGALG